MDTGEMAFGWIFGILFWLVIGTSFYGVFRLSMDYKNGIFSTSEYNNCVMHALDKLNQSADVISLCKELK